MTPVSKQLWLERAKWCIEQAEQIERTLPPPDGGAKSMKEVGASFLRDMAAKIIKGPSNETPQLSRRGC